MSLTPAPVPAETPLFARKYAVRLGLSLLLGFAVIIALNGYDESRRDQLETFEEATAVGDLAFFQVPAAPQAPYPVAATFNGQPLFPVSYEIVEVRDSKMIRAGVAEGTSLRIYVPREPLPLKDDAEPEESAKPAFYLKVNRDEYIQVRPGSPGK